MKRLAAILALVGACPAMAQPPEVVLARMAIAESGWQDLETAAAEVYVIRRRAARRGMSVTTMARAYSAAWRTRRRPWLFGLADRTRAPQGWPVGPSWRRHRPFFRRMVEHARGCLEGVVADPCADEAPDHFGGPRDAVPESWRRAECLPESRQRFWVSGAHGGEG